MLTLAQLGAMGGLLLFGGITTVSQNDYLMHSTTNFPNYIGQIVQFNYPWFGNFIMFAAMTLIGFLWMYQARNDPKKNKVQYASVTKRLLANPWIVLTTSSMFDLAASGLMSVGLDLGVPASVYQMLNGSIVIFTPILSFFCLKRKINRQQGFGMLIVVGGLVTVALSSFFVQKYFSDNNQDDNSAPVTTGNLILGMMLIIVSQIIYAAQFVVEEYTMQLLQCYPAQVVCIEGIYGFIVTTCFVMPLFDLAGSENDFDAFIFMKADPMITIPMMLFFTCVAAYNAFGQTVTKLISANHRTIVEGLRGLVVWIFSLLERLIMKAPWGEGWNGWASWVEVAGFVIQLVGSFVFYDLIHLGRRVIEIQEDSADEEKKGDKDGYKVVKDEQ
ncbi:Conserved_hypothetical protein [Hexamita inflata]|uniref:Uncharacterized protein n=1 Tax=Hexamita inflata TaxID=28002 RepID=A0AA86RZJ2_9EUKA|nr:Conserved hypothetical protein [Hexamita inflata]